MNLNIPVTSYHWTIFIVLVLGLLILDLWKSFRNPHRIAMKEALLTSLGWVSLAFAFNLWIYFEFGYDAALAFLTGYLLEESLSVDNLFVFLLIFSHFRIPEQAKHSVLFYGILGAIIMRAGLIWGGIKLVATFSWMFYVFGAFLIYSGYKLAFKEDTEIQLEKKWIYRFLSKIFPFTHTYHGSSFFVQRAGKWVGTPLLIVLALVETTDLIFALDSVPAILGITTNPFIVYTSNIFAILGLRSLFFVLEESMQRFYLLHYALALILVLIGVKMLLINIIHIPVIATLCIILLLIGMALYGSYLFPEKSTQKKNSPQRHRDHREQK